MKMQPVWPGVTLLGLPSCEEPVSAKEKLAPSEKLTATVGASGVSGINAPDAFSPGGSSSLPLVPAQMLVALAVSGVSVPAATIGFGVQVRPGAQVMLVTVPPADGVTQCGSAPGPWL